MGPPQTMLLLLLLLLLLIISLFLYLSLYIYIYVYTHTWIACSWGSKWGRHLWVHCGFHILLTGTFWVLPLTCFYLSSKCQGVPFFQNLSNNHYFRSGPLSVDPIICPQPKHVHVFTICYYLLLFTISYYYLLHHASKAPTAPTMDATSTRFCGDGPGPARRAAWSTPPGPSTTVWVINNTQHKD